MPRILTPPHLSVRAVNIPARTSTAMNNPRRYDVADVIVVIDVGGGAGLSLLSLSVACGVAIHFAAFFNRRRIHPPETGRREKGGSYSLSSSPFLSGVVAISAASNLKNESRETISIFFIDASGGGRNGLPSSCPPPPPRRRPTQYHTSHPWKYQWPAEAVLYISTCAK